MGAKVNSSWRQYQEISRRSLCVVCTLKARNGRSHRLTAYGNGIVKWSEQEATLRVEQGEEAGLPAWPARYTECL